MPPITPFTPAAPTDLIAAAPSADTVYVTDAYTVAGGETLALRGSPGFKLVVREGASVSLDIEGTATLRGGTARDKLIGIVTTQATYGAADVHIGAGGTLSLAIDGAGSVTGASMLAQGSTLDNEGQLRVEGQDGDFTIGAAMSAAGSVFTNEGQVHVSAASGTVLGVYGSINQSLADISLTNSGLIEVENTTGLAYGFGSQASSGSLDNQGRLVVHAAFAEGLVASSGVVQSNSGTVQAIGIGDGGGAVAAQVSTLAGMTNAGLLLASANGAAYGAWFLGGGVLDNEGAIVAEGGQQSAGVYVATNEAIEVVNHGTIRGGYAIVAQDALGSFSTVAAETVSNFGRLIGDVVLGGDGDTVTNTGRIDGDVSLGDGDDLFDSSHGRLNGLVIGGLGDDRLTGSGGADSLWGDEQGDGIGGGDDLLRGMKGDDTLSGGQGQDTLVGGAGADNLTGGADDDVFSFTKVSDSTGAAYDLISDLTDTDRIDLHAIDADTVTGGDQAFHLVGSFSGAAGELVVVYDAGTGITTISGDVDGDGAADLVITADGDDSGFSDFVL